MKRLTKDNPQENFEIMMNYVFAKDGWAHIRHDGERENVPLTEWVKAQCIKRGCDEFPGEPVEEIDMTVCDCLMDGEGCPVALAYCFACQASHLRDRLKAIEDILGDEYDLDHLRTLAQLKQIAQIFNCDPSDQSQLKALCDKFQIWQQAEKEGRLVVLLCKKDELPAADVAPVRHGQWDGEGDGYAETEDGGTELVYDVWRCSACGYTIDDGTDDPERLPNYCPSCGAKMSGEGENE